MVGFAITPEGINQNWIAYELMLETPWWHAPLSDAGLAEWVGGFAQRRAHGSGAAAQAHAASAWKSLASSVYNLSCAAPSAVSPHNSSKRSCPAQREPSLGFHSLNRQPTQSRGTLTSLFYEPKLLVAAWRSLLAAATAADADAPSTLLHDLVDVGREALALCSDVIADGVHRGVKANDAVLVAKALMQMDKLFVDLDALAGTDQAFLLGPWVQNASSWGRTAAEKALFSYNAKYQITGWRFHEHGKLPGTGDYAVSRICALFVCLLLLLIFIVQPAGEDVERPALLILSAALGALRAAGARGDGQ